MNLIKGGGTREYHEDVSGGGGASGKRHAVVDTAGLVPWALYRAWQLLDNFLETPTVSKSAPTYPV